MVFDLLIDPEFKVLIPPLEPNELKELEESILKEGCRDALVVWKETNTLLDGHNRLQICKRLGKPYQIKLLSLPDRDAAKIWVINNQFARRNLSPYQRSVLALRVEEIYRQKAKENERLGGGSGASGRQKSDNPIDTKKEIAKVARVSHDTIMKVKKIEVEGSPEQKEKLARGEATINEVYKSIRKSETDNKRNQIGNEAIYKYPTGNEIYTGDYSLLYQLLPDNSVDLFFTDPPYDKESIELFGRLAKLAQAKLKPSGLCLTYSGQSHLNEVFASMSQHLDYWWTFAIFITGDELRIWSKNLWVRWKPVLVFTKRPSNGRLTDTWCCDHISGVGGDKRFHKLGQNVQEAAYWIEMLTPVNGLVVDPFCGAGTIPLACKLTNRRWLATDIDEKAAALARKRLQDDQRHPSI